jgi:periplasmic protein CpxP/Spy
MIQFRHQVVRAAAAATVLGAFILCNPLPTAAGVAQAPAAKPVAPHEILAEAALSPATTEAAPEAAKPDPVEARIRELHNKLHIKGAQQTQWDNLVAVMRGNAKAMMDLQRQRSEDVKSMTAVDAVKSYAAVIEAHETGMGKFVPAFQALYESMSDSQKKIADSMFRQRVRTATAKANDA